MNERTYDSETIRMIVQDFCGRQDKLIMQEVFAFIANNFMDAKSLVSQNSELFELNKVNVNEYIKRIDESEYYNKYIRIPKPLQDYLYVRKIVNQEVSKQIFDIRTDFHMDFINSIHKVNRGLRRETPIVEQRMSGEYE